MVDERATGAAAGSDDAPGEGALSEAWVREILRCPSCGSVLRDSTRPDGAPELVCTGESCALAYPVRDGIPVLLMEESYPSGGTV
jgi:uncharacterized protein